MDGVKNQKITINLKSNKTKKKIEVATKLTAAQTIQKHFVQTICQRCFYQRHQCRALPFRILLDMCDEQHLCRLGGGIKRELWKRWKRTGVR